MGTEDAASTTISFDAQGISLILDSCARNGVAILKFGELEVWFGPKAGPTPKNPPLPPGSDGYPVANEETQTPSPGTEMPNHEKITQETLEQDERILREQQLEELAITDPVAYEKLVNAGGLEDVESGDESGSPV